MALFEVRLLTHVPVLWTVTVEAADVEAAKALALAHPYRAANDEECPAIIDNEWTGDTSNLQFDWETDTAVTVEAASELEMEEA